MQEAAGENTAIPKQNPSQKRKLSAMLAKLVGPTMIVKGKHKKRVGKGYSRNCSKKPKNPNEYKFTNNDNNSLQWQP